MTERYKPALGERVKIPGGRKGIVWSPGQEDNGSGGGLARLADHPRGRASGHVRPGRPRGARRVHRADVLMRATDPLRVAIADVVRDHPAVVGQPAAVIDDLVDQIETAAREEGDRVRWEVEEW